MDSRSVVWGKWNREVVNTLDLPRSIRGDPLSWGILSRGAAERVLGEYGMGLFEGGFWPIYRYEDDGLAVSCGSLPVGQNRQAPPPGEG